MLDVWDQYAAAYWNVMRYAPFHRRLIARSVEALGCCHTVLDAGCGPGLLADRLAHEVSKIYCLDQNTSMLAYATRMLWHRNAYFVQESIEALPFGDSFFDGVAALNVLCYLSDPMPIIREILRVLRPGGRVVLSGPGPHVDPGKLTQDVLDHVDAPLWARMQQHMAVMKECNDVLIESHVKHFCTADEILDLLRTASFRQILQSDDDEYLGQCYFVVAVK